MNWLTRIAMALSALMGPVTGIARAEVTAEQVRQAIRRGNEYLLSRRRDDGSWPESSYRGGVSALCTLALVNGGVKSDDPRIQKSLDYLRTIPPDKTYVVSLVTMALARAEPVRDRELIVRNVGWLEKTQVVDGPNQGAWAYPYKGGSSGDPSNSQFALLALREAERVGIPTSDRTWWLAKTYWEQSQNPDGSWGYMGARNGTGSMTCAGIASLVIIADRIDPSDARASGDGVECCCRRAAAQPSRIDRAFRWLGEHFSVEQNPGEPQPWALYYLYGLERAGRLTARRFIPLGAKAGQSARADWYREGADRLVRTQDQLSGFWTGVPGGKGWSAWEEPLIGTSFALLFLSKGRWPVVVGKLQTEGDDWNWHRSDVGNLVRYAETRWKRDLTWQVIDWQRASVDDLLQVPVLHLSGAQSPLPKDPVRRGELARKLRDYLDRGGFLFADANCTGEGFDRGFRELVKEAFPEPEYRLRLLEPEHPIWQAEERVDPQQLRPLLGIDFDCRTCVVYSPPAPQGASRPSLSCLWELSRPGRGVKLSRAVEDQVDAALSLGINVLAYATDRELRNKEDFFRPGAVPTPEDPIERGRLDVANLRHPGGCNVTPRALWNLMETANDQLKLRVHVRPELLDIADDALFNHHLVFMHGRTAFRLTDVERQRLRMYLERGGMLLADSVCSSREFGESFRQEMAAIFPDCKLERIPAADSLLSKTYGGFDLKTVSRRDVAAKTPGKSPAGESRKGPPELDGIRLDNHWAVVFSPYDLSCALEKQNSPACRGYTLEDAARIGLNVVLYSLQQ